MMRGRLLLAGALIVAAAAAAIQTVTAQIPQAPIRLRAFAVNMTNVAPGLNNVFEITIDNWSTAEQRQRLITTMVDKGHDALVEEMRKAPVNGRIRIPSWSGPDPQNYRLGWDLHYTWHEALADGGERIVIGTDRLMSMWELTNRPRSYDYPLMFMEIHMPKEGKGEGRMAVATQVTFDKKTNTIGLEQYSAGAVRLNEITVEKK
jgi:hypothetical protein